MLVYEMVIGMRPFTTASKDVNKKYSKILYDDIIFPDERHSCQISIPCRDFIKKLLAKDPSNRLGSNCGIEEILSHPWFKGLDLDAIFNKELDALYKPPLSEDIFDIRNFSKSMTCQELVETIVPFAQVTRVSNLQARFKGVFDAEEIRAFNAPPIMKSLTTRPKGFTTAGDKNPFILTTEERAEALTMIVKGD